MKSAHTLNEQGVALTGRNTTGPPRLPLVSYVAYASVTDDANSWPSYTMCRRASNEV